VTGVFRFSELALVVTEGRVVKHIGSSVWSEDYEVFPYEDLSEVSFERGSVATEVVMTIDGRPQRIKTPNDHARKVQQVIERAGFGYYDVESLEQLNRKIADEDASGGARSTARRSGGTTGSSDIEIGGGIDPLVEDDDDVETADIDEPATGSTDRDTAESSVSKRTQSGGTGSSSQRASNRRGNRQSGGGQAASDPTSSEGETVEVSEPDSADIDAVEAQLDELTTAVRQQNELLKKQQQTIKQLIEELRDGR
jgi:hypothetical protein